MMLKPSLPRLISQSSIGRRWFAACRRTTARHSRRRAGRAAHRELVARGDIDQALAAALAGVGSGIGGNCPSGSKPEASVPSCTESEAMACRNAPCCRALLFLFGFLELSPTTTKAPQDLRCSGLRPIFSIRPLMSA